MIQYTIERERVKKVLRNPRLTFVLGLVLALITVWCNAVPTRVDAEEMSEVTGGCYEKCQTDPDTYCQDCTDRFDDCTYHLGDNDQECVDQWPESKPCTSTACKDKNTTDEECE